MHLDEGMDLCRIKIANAAAQGVGVATAIGDVIGQATTGIGARDIQRPVRKRAESPTATDIRYLKPDALLGAHAHDGDVARRCQTHPLDGPNGHEPGHDARGAVEIAAVRHAVEMRAGENWRQRAVPARQRHVGVGGGVGADLEPEIRWRKPSSTSWANVSRGP